MFSKHIYYLLDEILWDTLSDNLSPYILFITTTTNDRCKWRKQIWTKCRWMNEVTEDLFLARLSDRIQHSVCASECKWNNVISNGGQSIWYPFCTRYLLCSRYSLNCYSLKCTINLQSVNMCMCNILSWTQVT